MKIMLATGGSGGHIFPALSTAQVLQAMGHDTIFAGVFPKGKDRMLQGFHFFPLSAVGLSLSSIRGFLQSGFRMTKAFGESRAAIRDFRPDVVCGFGGYGAFPIVAMSVLLKVPSMIHEQNVVPGRANRMLAKSVTKIAISFKESRKFFPQAKTVLTGSPCHAQRNSQSQENLRDLLGLDPAKFLFLVVGGSQGSRRINQVFLETVPLLKNFLDFQVIHLCGRGDVEELASRYQVTGIKFRVFDFLEDIGAAYQSADCVIARAGAGTIVDIAQFQLPSVLIPYPHAGGHQKENAGVLVAAGCAGMIEEKDLSAEILRREILKILDLKLNQTLIGERVKDIVFKDAANRIANEILSTTR